MPFDQDDTFFGAVRSALSSAAGRVVESVAPRCCEPGCGRKVLHTPIPCMLCGRYSCANHGFFNAGMLTSLCLPCLRDHGIETDPDKRSFFDGLVEDFGGGQESEVELDYPWSELGIAPTQDLRRINTAYRGIAAKTHPDHCQGTKEERAEAESRFRRATAARDEAIRIAKGEG